MPVTEGREAAVHYSVEGPPGAPLLLLANSLGTTSAMWEPQVGALTQWFRVVRYEHRGHGGAPAPPGPYSIADLAGDALAALEAAGAGGERFSVCGLSLGGMVGMWLAAHVPERVERVVLCCTAAKLGTPEDWQARAALVRAEGMAPVVEMLLGRWFTPGFREASQEVVDVVASMLLGADPDGYAGCCEAIGAMDQRADLARIAAPALVVGGALDPVVPPALAVELQGGIDGAALAVLSGAAHLANLEHPRRFTGLLLDHLAGLAVHRGDATRRAVLGDEYVDRAARSATPLSAPLQDLIVRYAWADVWSRPGLDRRTRSCITLAMLVALGRHEELELHLRAARRIGLTDAEIGEVLLQAAVYAGVPAANSAFAVARRVLGEGGGGGAGGGGVSGSPASG